LADFAFRLSLTVLCVLYFAVCGVFVCVGLRALLEILPLIGDEPVKRHAVVGLVSLGIGIAMILLFTARRRIYDLI